jgi:hypothetical protein
MLLLIWLSRRRPLVGLTAGNPSCSELVMHRQQSPFMYGRFQKPYRFCFSLSLCLRIYTLIYPLHLYLPNGLLVRLPSPPVSGHQFSLREGLA